LKDTHIGFRLDLAKFHDSNVTIQVENLSFDTLDDVMKLDYALFDSFNASKEEIVQMIDSKNELCLITKVHHEVIGFIMMSDLQDEQCFIRNLGIAKSHSGKGYGYQLLIYALNKAKQLGSKQCFLWVGSDNE